MTVSAKKKPRDTAQPEPVELPSETENHCDEKLLEGRLCEELRKTGYFFNVSCEVTVHVDRNGHVLLHGIVPSYYLKQKAQIAVISVCEVNSLRNELVVP